MEPAPACARHTSKPASPDPTRPTSSPMAMDVPYFPTTCGKLI